MPLQHVKEAPELAIQDEEIRQFIINETGVEDPSPTFIQECLNNMQGYLNNLSEDDSEEEDEEDQPPGLQVLNPAMTDDSTTPSRPRQTRSGAPSPDGLSRGTKIYNGDSIYLCRCEKRGRGIRFCNHTEGQVTVLSHEAGVNDLVSGVLSPRGNTSPTVVVPVSPQDAVACRDDWVSVQQYQPNGVLSLQLLKEMEVFGDGVLDSLPSGYFTTVTGLLRAWKAAEGPDGEMLGDGVIVNALWVRGGEVKDPTFVDAEGYTKESVVYAEDLVPYVGAGEERYDAEFWERLAVLREENVKSGLVDLVAWAMGDVESDVSEEMSDVSDLSDVSDVSDGMGIE